MKLINKTESSSYLAKIFILSNLIKHSNADKLLCTTVDYNNVITGLSAKEGDLYVYFPIECAINKDYLAYSNSFSDAEKNADKTKKGFFNDKGRVRAISLRGEKSEGYIVPVVDIINWLNSINIKSDISDWPANTEFSHVDDILICQKYIPLNVKSVSEKTQKEGKKAKKQASILIDDQFRFHSDTAQFKKNIHNLSPNDRISISYKIHGTSFVAANILVKKKLSIFERLLQKLGFNIISSKYSLVYSSRKVIKSDHRNTKTQNFYDLDIWGLVAKNLEPYIENGISVYGEIYGFTPSGKCIQKDYDYSVEPTKHAYAIYRITYTTPEGRVIEFTEDQIIKYAQKYNLSTVPYLYIGYAKDLFPDISLSEHWNEEFLKRLMEKYTEKDCFMCKNKVPEEGVVLRKMSLEYNAFKLKSFRFLEKESKQSDSGELDIETEQSIPETDSNPVKE